MLIRYKKSFEKIAMGLLSFMPDEKDVKKLLATIKQYENLDHWQLYLWRKEEDIIGIIGVVTENDYVIIQHISVNPSHRYQGLGKTLITEISALYSDKQIKAADSITAFFEKCQLDQQS